MQHALPWLAMQQPTSCPLCVKVEKAKQQFADELVWEFKESFVFLGPWQYYQGYCIVTAKTHFTELFELSTDQRHTLMDEVARMAQAIHQVVKPRKMNYEWLGNQVPHLHWHLFPRQQDDPHHLQATWLDIAEAERDAQRKQQWQQCRMGKPQLIAALQQALRQ